MPTLEILDISNNYLGTLLPSLYQSMPNLAWLVATHNGFTSLSSTAFHNLNSLVGVDLSHNNIFVLPEDIFIRSPNLQYVFMEGNMLKYLSIRHFQNASNIHTLNFNDNHLTDADMEILGTSSLSALAVVVASRNRITSLTPSMFQEYANLLYLDVSDNRIENVSDETFSQINNLQYLFLQKNHLRRITDKTFHGLNGLLQLNISQNNLDQIDDDALSTSTFVTNLDISQNRLLSFPVTIRFLSQLQMLDLRNNTIRNLPTLASMRTLDNLLGLSLKNNSITVLQELGFSWAPNLQVLNLAGNEITIIHPRAFALNRNLIHLVLEANQITTLQEILLPLNQLGFLYAAHNHVASLSSHAIPSSLTYIDLSYNQLSELQPKIFMHLDSLSTVMLIHNQLRSFSPESLYVSSIPDHQPQMYLRGNWLNCTCEMAWLRTIPDAPDQNSQYPMIMDYDFVYCKPRELIPSHSLLDDLDDDQMVCDYQESCVEPQCDCCGQTQCPCHCQATCYPCPTQCSCYQTADKLFNLVDCRERGLSGIPSTLHPGTTLAYLDGNNFTHISAYSFTNSSNLTSLYLNGSSIRYIEEYAFEGLLNLKELYLGSNELECILYNTLYGLDAMNVLSLSNNKLRDIANDTLLAATYLMELDLSNNKLSTLPNDIRDYKLNLTIVRLSGNPWSCECAYGPSLKGWVVNNAKTVVDNKAMLCHLPNISYSINTDINFMLNDTKPPLENYIQPKQTYEFEIRTIHGKDYQVQKSETSQPYLQDICPPNAEIGSPTNSLVSEKFDYCYNDNTLEVRAQDSGALQSAMIAIAVVLFVSLTLTLLMFNSRELIKVWLFTHYGLRFHKQREEDDKDFDAFISYSSHDEEYVCKTLAPKLESGNAPYKLLLHYRDWVVGGSITESIIESVESSKRIILVLSDNYCKSEWCQYEFKTAHHNVMKEHKNRIVVILLGDKLPKGMDKELKLYTKTTTYLRHDDPWFWNKLKYALPEPVDDNDVGEVI